MTSKLIKGIDEQVWRKFVAYCKIKGVNVGDELGIVLKEHNDKKLKNVI
ncbi:MAG: hypothetical protein ABIC04_04400 [Nanoarchaeota archaeon]